MNNRCLTASMVKESTRTSEGQRIFVGHTKWQSGTAIRLFGSTRESEESASPTEYEVNAGCVREYPKVDLYMGDYGDYDKSTLWTLSLSKLVRSKQKDEEERTETDGGQERRRHMGGDVNGGGERTDPRKPEGSRCYLSLDQPDDWWIKGGVATSLRCARGRSALVTYLR